MYKVLITTSGVGSRLGDLTNYTNKCLIRVGKKPAISYIVEKSKNVGDAGQKGYMYISNGKGNCKLGFDDTKEAVEEAILRKKFIIKK